MLQLRHDGSLLKELLAIGSTGSPVQRLDGHQEAGVRGLFQQALVDHAKGTYNHVQSIEK